MKTRLLYCLLMLFFSLTINAQNILMQTDSIFISNSKVWGGISYDGKNINITTMMVASPMMKHIYLIKFDTALNQLNTPVQLTTDNDLYSGRIITDHKHIYMNNQIYLAYSLEHDQELFLFKTDTAGNRIGLLDSVAIGSLHPTNDMILTSDSTNIHVLYYYPPNQHIIETYDLSLNKVRTDTTSNQLPHNNIGGTVYKDSTYYLFTGNTFGHNADLILTQWNKDWTPLSNNASQILINSSNGDGSWFATGCAYDEASELWFLGFQHIEQSSALNDEHIDMAVFDKNFNLLERYHVTDSIHFRPHFLILDGYLYMVYDRAGNGVLIHKYKINNTLSGKNALPSVQTDSKLKIYPNPFTNSTVLEFKNDGNNTFELNIFDIAGNKVKTMKNINGTRLSIKKGHLPPGHYFVELSSAKQNYSSKFVVK